MTSTVQTMTKVSPLSLADFAVMPYSPAFLLDSKFDVSMTDDSAFREGCEFGFVTYFDEMYEADEQGNDVFVERRYSWAEVVEMVVDEVLSEEAGRLLPCVERAGVLLGWLSALALTDRAMAVRALTVGEALLIPSDKPWRQDLREEPVRPVYHLCPRSVDTAGWPLDM